MVFQSIHHVRGVILSARSIRVIIATRFVDLHQKYLKTYHRNWIKFCHDENILKWLRNLFNGFDVYTWPSGTNNHLEQFCVGVTIMSYSLSELNMVKIRVPDNGNLYNLFDPEITRTIKGLGCAEEINTYIIGQAH